MAAAPPRPVLGRSGDSSTFFAGRPNSNDRFPRGRADAPDAHQVLLGLVQRGVVARRDGELERAAAAPDRHRAALRRLQQTAGLFREFRRLAVRERRVYAACAPDARRGRRRRSRATPRVAGPRGGRFRGPAAAPRRPGRESARASCQNRRACRARGATSRCSAIRRVPAVGSASTKPVGLLAASSSALTTPVGLLAASSSALTTPLGLLAASS